MATLTEISVYSRKAIIWLIAIVIGFIVLKILLNVFTSYWRAAHPPPAAKPNVLFDKLPTPQFPEDMKTSAGLTIKLENIEGRPPETTPSGMVYFMPKKLPSLLAPAKAKDFAARIEFLSEPQVISTNQYRFIDTNDPKRVLNLDIINLNFDLTYDYASDPSTFEKVGMDEPDKIIETVKGYMQNNGLVDSSIFSVPPVVIYYRYDSTTHILKPVIPKEDADAARVDFFRPDIFGYKMLTSGYNRSYNYAIISTSGILKNKFLKINYTFWPIDFGNAATYPLRTSQSAWEDLVAGNGMVATMGENTEESTIVIRKIYLAYYDSGFADNYLQPIFVFEGDRGFFAYVPAILKDWLE
ncbi:hypothetical protein A2773_04570 [Candidatus Gottesmanbacteria bacterium RIFCSPHIGHO2_01_FULL_39_10]|uniref:Uncharacterized protein n=1 Tax=Candidatus Gottesmanbacteria bacterium RIFCSPHIGHO2_01_FULL_39_10 TaxID=1798375 RepID=A0A1F5ZRK4_9BACT|nr:MAG: hypothetical protein A2773_04570 [Candidatus Gottesmanbacteria bacterium RIFCSPHIGHO2_01_FULL_39_10]